MPTFAEFVKVVRLTKGDHRSRRRLLQILGVLRRRGIMHGMTPERAVRMLEDLGPTYVKMGQIVSTRSDILPKEYCDAFSQLHANVAPMPFDEVLDCISASYGSPWQDVFSSVDSTPLGSASIAQVHRAQLHDGSIVAVKVRRPGVVEETLADIALMKRILATAEFLTSSHRVALFNFDSLVSELERTCANEVDFGVELRNLVAFRRVISNQRGVSSPTPYPSASNESVLVMEYVDGRSVDDVAGIRSCGLNVDRLADRLVQSYISQVLEAGFFHADPHSGNILVRNGEIVWIDLGMVGTLTSGQRGLVGQMFRSIAANDPFMLMEAVVGISAVIGEVDHGSLLSQLSRLLAKYGMADLRDIDMGSVFAELIEVLRSQNLVMEQSVTMLARGIISLEGVLSLLAPGANVFSLVNKHMMRQSLRASSIEAKAVETASVLIRSIEAASRLPSQMGQLLDMLSRGEVAVRGNIEIERKALSSVYSSAGRFSLSIISAGLFLGSSLLCTTDMEPRVLEVPILGILGYLGAFALGIYVIVVTFRSRHL